MALLLVIGAISAFVGYMIGEPKERGASGALLGGLLGLIGLVIIAVMKPLPETQGPVDPRVGRLGG
jgi:hypothetical protein